jgi:putative membrane-bound dehydrogenase-like protein
MCLSKIVFRACQACVVTGFLVSNLMAQNVKPTVAGQLGSEGVWTLRIELTDAEFAAMEPAAPQGLAFGGPTPPVRKPSGEPKRDTVANLFGTQFPWVQGVFTLMPKDSNAARGGQKCRLRYDGDFTYLMAAGSPKRPLFLELLDGEPIAGSTRFRLHTMQFDPTMLRERVAAHVFAAMHVPVSRVMHAEVELVVGGKEPRSIGLYAALEAVDAALLSRNEMPATSLMIQTNGLNTIQHFGDEWTAYAPLFRMTRLPTKQEQDRIIAFAKFVGDTNDQEFSAKIDDFIDTSSLLRYVAANSLTSNLTGFSNIGANDYLCLAPDGKFHFVASEMEVALSGSVLSGTPDQLVNLSLTHPYAGECKLVDRLMKDVKLKEAYFQIVRDFVDTSFNVESMSVVIDLIEAESAAAREKEIKAAAERVRQSPAGFEAGPGFGPGSGGPEMPAPMDVRTFVTKRVESVMKQLNGDDRGYVPSPPNFGGFGGGGNGGGFGPPRRQATSAPISKAEFSEGVQVPPDFEATLFAKSPEVNYPVAIAAEPSGAIYVASDEQGSLGTDKNGGKVLRCVDNDGDGTMDSVTTFCKVDHVRGVAYRGGAVWVCHPPFLSVFHDDNADGVADRNQQLVSGLTTELVNSRGGDHTTNGVRMGVDGWLYIGDGDYGVPEAKGIDGSAVVLRGGGILRVRPDGTELELFASGLRNPFDIAIDPQLNMFTRDNTNDGGGWDTRVSQLFQSAEYGYPRLFANFSDEIMPTLGAFGGGGGTGSLYIEDMNWPARFNKSLFTGDWGRSAVFHHPLTADGPTFALTQEPFATIPRATGMDIDAAGNLYVASWWSGEASVYVGPHVGFVTRITPEERLSRVTSRRWGMRRLKN